MSKTIEFPKVVYNPKSELDGSGAYSERETIYEAAEKPKGWTDNPFPERETDKPAPKPKSKTGGAKTAKKDESKKEDHPLAGLDITEDEARAMLEDAEVEIPENATADDIARLTVETFGDNG